MYNKNDIEMNTWIYYKKKSIKNRKLIQLQPVLKNDLICVVGRLRHAQIPAESKHQVIIPSNHHLTYLLLYIHQNNHHCDREQLLALSREWYWIVKGKHLARKVIYNCLYCKRQRMKLQPQLMADLPPERLSYLQPQFSFTGIGCFGPATVKRGYWTRSLPGHTIKDTFTYLPVLLFMQFI